MKIYTAMLWGHLQWRPDTILVEGSFKIDKSVRNVFKTSDLRIVPAVVAVYLIVGFVGDAAQKHTAQAAMLATIAIATALAIAWAATHYLLRPAVPGAVLAAAD